MANTKEQEVWKQYPEFDFIEVSNLGRVRTKDRVVSCNGGKRLVKGHVLKQWLRKNGYLQVQVHINGKTVNLSVNRMVAICFIPNPNNYPEVNHKDNNRTNNVASNLEWCTHKYNIAYRDKLGRTAKHNAPKKPVIAVNLEASEVFWFESQSEAARQLRVVQESISRVVKGQQNRAGDYWFINADDNAIEKVRARFNDEIVKKVEKLLNEHRN